MLRRALCTAALSACLQAQSIVPAKAGLVSYADEAYIDDRLVEFSPTRFTTVNENAVFRTGAGRAEMLLGACSAMWVDERSSVRVISSALSDVRLELLHGSVVVATGWMVKDNKVTLLLKTSVTPLDPKGAYRFDAEPARVKVLSGKTIVQWVSRAIPLSAGHVLLLGPAAHPAKFDKQNPGPFENWSIGRAEYLAELSGQHPPLNPIPARIERVPSPIAVQPALSCGVSAW